MQHNIILPDLGQTTSEARIVEWLKKPGDRVERGEAILAVQTDKVDMEVEAFASGFLREILVPEGAIAAALRSVAILTDTPEEDYEPATQLELARSAAAAAPVVAPGPAPAGRVQAAPAARRLAKELGVDLSAVQGSGPNGLIRSADVRRFAEAQLVAGGPGWQRALAAMAATAVVSKREIPHFYVTRDLEVGAAAHWRDHWNQSSAARASFNDVFVWCAARALADVPRLNVAYRDGAFEQRAAADVLVIAAREPALLLLPVRDPRGLGWSEFLDCMRAAAGGRFSGAAPLLAISNLGMHGVKEFAAIVPPGCSSVLAIGAVREVPVARNGRVTVERIATATLSADHRVVDGVTAARFLERMQYYLNSL